MMDQLQVKLTKEIIRDECDYTFLKLSDTVGQVYFYTIINGGAFGKATAFLDPFKAPIVEFINPRYQVDCTPEWAPSLRIRKYIDSVMVCQDLTIPKMDWSDVSSLALLQELFGEKLEFQKAIAKIICYELHDYIWKPECNDGTVGIRPRLDTRELSSIFQK